MHFINQYTRLVFICILCIGGKSPTIAAQWESTENDIIPEGYKVETIKVAPDRSIWCIANDIMNESIDTTPSPIVLRSVDKGKTWSISFVSVPDYTYVSDISPINDMIAYIALDTTGLFRTIDGGQTWKKVESYRHPCIMVHFFNAQDGWVFDGVSSIQDVERDSLAASMMSLTADGGKTWVTIGGVDWLEPPGTSLPEKNRKEWPGIWKSVGPTYDYHNASIAIGMSNGTYWLSNDRGYNWKRYPTPLVDSGLVASNVAIRDSNTIMVAGNLYTKTLHTKYDRKIGRGHKGRSSVTCSTQDGGITWCLGFPEVSAESLEYIPGSDSIFVMTSCESAYGGSQGTAITYDFGLHWETIDNNRIREIDFVDGKTAFGSCGNLGFYETANGQIFKWDFPMPVSPYQLQKYYLWVLILLMAIGLFAIFWIRRKRKSNKRKTAEQILQLEQSAIKAQIDSGFIFNNLNAIQELMNSGNRARANDYITSFAKLTRGVLRASSETSISLEEDLELLKNYLKLEKLHYENRLTYNVEIDTKLDMFNTIVPSMVVQSIVESRIRLGLATPSNTGNIAVEYRLLDKILEIIIKDNFEVMDEKAEQTSNANENLKMAGIGHVKERLDQVQMFCEMSVERLKNTDGKTGGTMTTIEIMLD